MAQSGKTQGACAFCGKRATRGGMSRHLQSCPARKQAILAADAKGGERETILHLQVQDAGSGEFWLHLEMRGSATLKKLDDYLRAIWLECCGHLSEFSRGGWGSPKIAMSRRADQALGEGMALTHYYDFGSTTATQLKVVGIREGTPLDRRPIRLMARNDMPALICGECGAPGARLCMECMYEDTNPVLCEAHAATHPHEDYGEPMPLVNSPRVGVCGYEGPAEPPY
jgi:hypothetical protein